MLMATVVTGRAPASIDFLPIAQADIPEPLRTAAIAGFDATCGAQLFASRRTALLIALQARLNSDPRVRYRLDVCLAQPFEIAAYVTHVNAYNLSIWACIATVMHAPKRRWYDRLVAQGV